MADVKITDLQLVDEVTGDLNFPVDDTLQTYRATAAQMLTYLTAAISAKLAITGSVLTYAGSTAPTGYLECDGSAVSRTTYAALFTAIGVTHGYGDNSTTFNLPDYRGKFLRGWAHGQTTDPDKASRTAMATGGATGDNVGSVQGEAYLAHLHTVNDPSHSHTIAFANNQSASAGAGVPSFGASSLSTAASITGITLNTSGGNETRPKNANVMYCIKT